MNKAWFKYYKWRLLNPVIPCALCTIPSYLPICNHCFSELEINNDIYCTYCAKPGKPVCNSCQNVRPAFEHTYCNFIYSSPLHKLLHQLKYHKDKSNSWALGYLLNKTLVHIKSDTDIIIPMPISQKRREQRGFNQIDVMLEYYLAKSAYITVKTNIAIKPNDTPHQSLQNKYDRSNTQQVFTTRKNIIGLNILIIDDVITTGSTANSLAQTLKAAGANRVELCTLMRTV